MIFSVTFFSKVGRQDRLLEVGGESWLRLKVLKWPLVQQITHILWETTLVDWGFWKAFSWLKAGGDPRVKLPFPWQNGQWLQISHLFFFFFRIYLFNVLVVVGLCCCTWAFSSCCMWVSHCSGFSCCRREALAPWALVRTCSLPLQSAFFSIVIQVSSFLTWITIGFLGGPYREPGWFSFF